MTTRQKAPKQPQDPYGQRGKKLTSAVQRLRGWVGSDPSRSAELADALVELNMHRLLGHDYAAAAADAQDAVRRSADLLLGAGPIGPYTSVDDAVRYLTAVVHLAVTQAGLGLSEAAGRTIASMDDMMEQLKELPLQQRLNPVTAIWALSCSARSALAAGEIGRANAYADAALARLAESGLRADPGSYYLAVDTDRLASDCRWAAGRVEESLGFLHEAKERYDQMVDGRLREPAGLSQSLVNRLAEPLFGLYRDMADRLVASGEVDLGVVTRRELVALLRGLVGRRGHSAQVELAAALTDLADDLLRLGRVEEADVTASEAAKTMADSPGATPPARRMVRPGVRLDSWQPVPSSATPEDRVEPAAWLEAERAEARRLERERLEQARVEAARREAERAEVERAAAERAAEEGARAERAKQEEAERRMAAEEAERLERKRRRAERLEAHRLEVERREAEQAEEARREAAEDNALAVALEEWQESKSRGDRRAARAANERVVELLRPRARTDLASYGPQLLDALEELSRAHLRSGDMWGSRAPAKEAKALAKLLSR